MGQTVCNVQQYTYLRKVIQHLLDSWFSRFVIDLIQGYMIVKHFLIGNNLRIMSFYHILHINKINLKFIQLHDE